MRLDSRGIRYAIVGVTLGLLMTLVLYRIAATAQITAQIRQSQVTNAQTLNQSRELLHAIQDCTEPTGECYKRSQKATAGAVSSINQVVILAAACSAGLTADLSVAQRQSQIQACVVNRLASASHKR